ncbi:MAG: hypothetical protein Q8W51_13405 [Candidatus Palauibacterales bacterium]|nr:hypothetical protein [Candidatus Palauibacterales bacterium]
MAEGAREPSTATGRRLDVEAEAPFGGELKGTGELIIDIGDATQASLTFDHGARDRLVLGLHSKVGLRLSRTGSLTLEGAGRKDVLQGEIEGEVRARLTVARSVDVSVEQRFRSSGSTTRLQVRIRI